MAPRGVSTWRRPYTSIYNDNYRYGKGLYNDTLTDIEKRYSDSISRTQLRSDRPDLTFTTFSGSNLTSSPAPAGESSSSTREMYSRQYSSSPLPETPTRSAAFEDRLNATLKSAAYELDEEVEDVIRNRIEKRKQQILAKSASEATTTAKSSSSKDEESNRPKSLYDDATFWTLPKTSSKLKELDLDIPKSRRKVGGRQTPTNGPISSKLKDRSRDLQDQVDSMDKSMSDANNRLRTELSSLKARYNGELSDLSSSMDTTSQQTNDLQRQCKRQASQLQELQSAYNTTQRNIEEALEEMSVWQNKCKSLKKEMERLREEVETAAIRKSKD